MKQIVDKLNKIAKKIDESVEIPQTDLIIDSLDAITKAYGGTPNDSNLIVDKLEDIYNNISPAVSGNIEITENGENINVAPYATATVNVSGGGGGDFPKCTVTVINPNQLSSSRIPFSAGIYFKNNIAHYEVPILDGNTTEEMMFLYQNQYDLDQDGHGTFIFIGWALENTLITNMINCSILTDGTLATLIVVTDPTLDSSFTATMKTENG